MKNYIKVGFVLSIMLGFVFLLASCSTISVKVTYQTNGGEKISFETLDQGSIIKELPVPKRTGYTFIDWYEDENFDIKFNQLLPINRNFVLYAKWEINQYTLSFDTGLDHNIEPIFLDYNTSLNIQPLDIEGYSFLGWYRNEALTETFTLNRMPANNLKIYAKLSIKEYTVNFYVNGDLFQTRIVEYGESILNVPNVPFVEGQNGVWDEDDFTSIVSNLNVNAIYEVNEYNVVFKDDSGEIYNQQTVKHGMRIIHPEIEPSKIGYNFINYSKDLDTFIVTEEIIVYVIFQKKIFIVEFFDQFGTSLSRVTIEYGKSALAPEIITPEGFNFLEWDKNFNNVTEDLQINAVVKAIEYSIVYNAGEGLFNNGTSTKTLSEDFQSIIGVQEVPTRTDFQFIGWFTNSNFEGAQVIFSPQSTMPLNGLTLYAKWATIFTVNGVYIFERENLDTKLIEKDGENINFGFEDLVSSQQIIPTFEGYMFSHFVKDEIEYDDVSDLDNLSDLLDLEVYYKRLIVTITFVQNPEFAGGVSGIDEVTKEIYYNSSFSLELPLIEVQNSGFTASWDRTIFNQVKENIVVRAIYYNNSVKTITFMDDGSIKFIASESFGVDDVILTETSPLWILNKPRYRFLGWFTEINGGEKIKIEDMRFTNFESSQNIYARYIELQSFSTLSDINIDIVSNENIKISWTQEELKIDNTLPSKYIVVLNGFEIEVQNAFVDANETTVSLNIDKDDALFVDFSILNNPGLHSLRIRIVGDGQNHLSSTYSEVYYYEVDTDIEGNVTDVSIYDYFIIEEVVISGQTTKRYVFYTDMTYQFSQRYQFEILLGDNLIQADNNRLIVGENSGNFRFSISTDNQNPVVFEGRVVKSIRQFNFGSNIQTYNKETLEKNYLNEVKSKYLVGSLNPYYLDLRIIDNKGERIQLKDASIVYEIYLNDSVQRLTDSQLDLYVSISADNKLKFTEAAEGHTFRVIVRPRYQALMMTVDDIEFTFDVNRGYNAFTNQELKTLFSNIDVKTINIHSNITAELDRSQLNSDGSPKNIFGNPETRQTYGNVFGRAHSQIDNETFVINGNYMTVNGSNLPYSNGTSGSGLVGYSASFEIVSVQIAIFYYDVLNTSTIGLNNNHFKMNNLTIIGNTTTPSINYGLSSEEISNQETLMSRNSGGYNGIIVRNGSSTFNNLRVGYTLIAFTNNANGIKNDVNNDPIYMEVNYNKVYDNWANSFFVWGGTGVVINRSEIGQSGGAAIHLVDVRSGAGVDNPTAIIDNETKINNWISGEEAWFKAYAMSLVALQLKSLIQQNISQLDKSIIKNINNPVTGLPTQMINFILLSEPSKSAQDNELNPTTGSENRLMLTEGIKTTTIERSYNFLSQDPRVSGNNFLFPVGELSLTDKFMEAIGQAMGFGLSQAEAIQVAYIAGFYNLTVPETLQVLQMQKPLPVAVAELKPDHLLPKYLEVLSPVPIFDSGYSIVILEVFNKG